MAKVKCITVFYDLKEKLQRNPGDVFSCDKERTNLLKGLKLVEVLEEDKEEKPEPEKATPEVEKEKATATAKKKKATK